ncbi:hypothetical protein GQ457_18G000230 [Hibiscus cannabinus]
MTELTGGNILSEREKFECIQQELKDTIAKSQQCLEQKPNESLRQYAQRWREVAAQVQPPIQENEITPMFVDTLKGVLYDRLIGHPAVSFADIVMTGERIEDAVRKGKIPNMSRWMGIRSNGSD